MQLGQVVLFYDRRDESPVPAIVTAVHDNDRVNLKTIPDGDGPMRFQPRVPRRIGDDHLYSFEAGGPKPAVSKKRPAKKKK